MSSLTPDRVPSFEPAPPTAQSSATPGPAPKAPGRGAGRVWGSLTKGTDAGQRRCTIVGLLLGAGITGVLVANLVRVGQLQVRPSEALQELRMPRVTIKQEEPLRGDLMDRRGRLVASTRFARRVVIDPTIFAEMKDLDENTRRLAQAIGQPVEQVRDRIASAIAENARRATIAEGWPATMHLWAPAAQHEAAKDAPPQPPIASPMPALGKNDPFVQLAAETKLELMPPEQRAALEAQANTPKEPPGPPQPLRYLVMSDLLSDDREEAVRALLVRSKDKAAPRPIAGIVLERLPEREFVAGEAASSLIGMVGFGHKGLMGVEKRLDEELRGAAGRVAFKRDRSGRPLWIEEGSMVPASHGQSVRLSIDLEVQAIAHEELSRQVERMNAAGGRIVVLDSRTGEVLALSDIIRNVPEAIPFPWMPVDEKGKPLGAAPKFDDSLRYIAIAPDPLRTRHPAMGRNRCVEDVYEPGSTFKPFVWATITELGLIPPDKMIDTEGGRWVAPDGRFIEDVVERDRQTWSDVLVNSSNIGMVKGAQLLSFKQAHDLVRRFGFGSRTNVGLPGETGGLVIPLPSWKNHTQVSIAYGHAVGVTPVQMARAFAVFARPGNLAGTLPQLRLTAIDEGETMPVNFRVLPADVATLTREVMQHVVESVERRWMKDEIPEGGFRYDLFGKSGTALIPLGTPPKGHRAPPGAGGYLGNQFISSFVAGGPTQDPRLVCVVVIDDPGVIPGQSRKARYGSSAAGPVTRRVLERTLTYLGVPASPRPLESGEIAQSRTR